MRFLCLCVCLASLATPAWAELGVCFDPGRAPGQQFFWGFRSPADIAMNTKCTVVTKAGGQTDAQMQLIQSTVERPLLTPTTQPATKYLHVVPDPPTAGGLAVLQDAAGMQAIDDAIAAEHAKRQAWADEADKPLVCKYTTPDQINTKVDQVKTNNQNNINATSFASADKQQLINLSNRLTEAIRQVSVCDAARVSGGK